MRIPPTRGQCHAVFLLVHIAGLGSWEGKSAWVAAARQRRTIAALSFDLGTAVDSLVDWGLAVLKPVARVHATLEKLGTVADYTTLKSIALVLLRRRPPAWLSNCASDGLIKRELIPSHDLDALSWLGSDLDDVLMAVYRQVCVPADAAFLAKFGLAGEMAVISALTRSKRAHRHVSLISDAFGYDIEVKPNTEVEGLEVKTATQKTADRFLLSRNEFDVSRRMGSRWRLIQVVFSSSVIANGRAKADDIIRIRELPAAAIHSLAPVDETHFRWTEIVQVSPDENQWISSDLCAQGNFDYDFVSR